MDGRAAVPARGIASPPHLDTVRALHQTVVSLRTALELSKNELKELREKYERQSQIDYEDAIEKLTLENHILRRKIIDTHGEDNFDLGNVTGPRVDISFASPCDLPQIEQKPAESLTVDVSSEEVYSDTIIIHQSFDESAKKYDFCSTENLNSTERTHESELNGSAEPVRDSELNESAEELTGESEFNGGFEPSHESEFNGSPEPTHESEFNGAPEPTSQFESEQEDIKHTEQRSVDSTEELLLSHVKEDESRSTFRTKIELLSKFDVSIKVCSLEAGETFVSSTTSETESTTEFDGKTSEFKVRESFHREESRTQTSEAAGMAVRDADGGRSDKLDVRVRITSEENLLLEQQPARRRNRDTLNLDVDELSLRSMSEGDNSVFSESGEGGGSARAAEPPAGEERSGDCSGAGEGEAEGSGDESEVDDIELIFTTDESKDMSNLQEDLVSIREGEPWVPTTPAKSTPVLIKFHTLDPDFQPGSEDRENSYQQPSGKRVRLPGDAEPNGKSFDNADRPGILKSCDNKSDNYLNKSGRRLQSTDSLSCEYRGLSFDTTKSSSLELGSSSELLHREESVDSFQQHRHLGHRFSVVGETDISKCGVSEEDLASANLNARRNTCPNPFQYRPLPHRPYARQSGPFKATATAGSARARPILRADVASVRRENGAQTEVSALPPRWSSDGYLAHKVGPPLTTVPSRVAAPAGAGAAERPLRRHAPSDSRPSHRLAPATLRTDEARRVLLSDIGFTSMVPELSRSADPVWAAEGGGGGGAGAGAACGACGATLRSPATSPTRLARTGDTSRYLARGSYRSQYHSADRYHFSTSYIPPIASSAPKEQRSVWRSSLPDVRGWRGSGGSGGGGGGAPLDSLDTDQLLDDAEAFLRRSIDNLRPDTYRREDEGVGGLGAGGGLARPYIPAEPRHLRLGHTVKLITQHGRIAIGTVRYVGIAGSSASAGDSVVVGAVIPAHAACVPPNDGTHGGRRYFRAPPGHTALFVPFGKVVMAWAN